MDCEKFESTLMDELYEELDELTSAASKRHVAGCARCASLLHGLSATRRLAVLEIVEPPAGMAERILAATKEAQKVVPLRGRISRVVSLAGSWAMRPQTAMAAVFLLMIGSTSILLLRARGSLGVGGAMVVTEQGAPAASAQADETEHGLDPSQAAGAHGAFETHKAQSPAPVASSASNVHDSFLAKEELEERRASEQRGGSGWAAADEKQAPGGGAVAMGPTEQDKLDESRLNAGSTAGAPAPAATTQAPLAQNQASPKRARSPLYIGGKSDDDSPPPSQAPVDGQQAPPREESKGGGSFETAMTSYRAKNYDEAIRSFDALGAGGNVTAQLMAARSVRDSRGCGEAVLRFDQVSARAFGTQAGYDATLEGGICYRNMGSFDKARAQLGRLLTVPSHAARAQAQLDAISPRAGVRQAAPSKPAASEPKK